MASVKIRGAETVPLSLQLEDGATTKFPQAVVRDPAGTLLSTEDLSHVGLGLYTNTTFLMPAEVFVIVTYTTFNDASHTIESSDHLRAQDVFVLDVAAAGLIPSTGDCS